MKKFFLKAPPLVQDKDKDKDADEGGNRSPRSPRAGGLLQRMSPRAEDVVPRGCVSVRLPVEVAAGRQVRVRLGKASAVLAGGSPSLLWLGDEEARLAVELLKTGRDRPLASAAVVLSGEEDQRHSVRLDDVTVDLEVRRSNEKESEAGTVRLVAGGQDVALLFDALSPPLGLLARACRATMAARWPVPQLGEGQAHFSPRVFGKALKDEARAPITGEDKKDIDERDASLANLVLTVLCALYSHGYREQTRGFWRAQVAPLSSTVAGCAMCLSSDAVTLWGSFPESAVAALVAEHTSGPFVPLASTEGGHGTAGQVYRFGKQQLGKAQMASTMMRMRLLVARCMRQLATHVTVASWTQSVSFFLHVSSGKTAIGRIGKPSLRISMGSAVEDAVADPVVASSQPVMLMTLCSDMSGLVSDVSLRSWPAAALPVEEALARVGLGDAQITAPASGDKDVMVVLLHTTAAWRNVAWRGSRPLRQLKQAFWLAMAEMCAKRGFIAPLPHFPSNATVFGHDDEVTSAAHAFVTLVFDNEVGAYVEIHSLGRAKEFVEKLKLLHSAGVMSQEGNHLVTVKVPHSKVLVADARGVTTSFVDNQFADDRAQVKAMRAAESRCFTVLMRVLSEVCNACQMEPLSTSARQTLALAMSTLPVLAGSTKNHFTAADEPPAMSHFCETVTPDFGRISWTQTAVQGFVLRETSEHHRLLHERSKWIRVTSSGKFSDVHGEFTQKEAEELIDAAAGDKVVAARDEKKNLVCWSIAHGGGGGKNAGTERMVEEARTFDLVVKLLARGWQLGPEGADHGEAILFKGGE